MKALVIGGSNGIGLVISGKLIARGMRVIIMDRVPPEAGYLPVGGYEYIFSDLMELDEDQFASFAKDPELGLLMVTAGIGRVADFASMHTAEIRKMMTINAVSVLQILRIFYDRIRNQTPFYCGVMGSIAGLLCSPAAAVYASSKAAVCRLVESVNVELEAAGTTNRILNVAPGSFQGSRFYGGRNQPELLEGLAEEILVRLFASETLFIPGYEETFRDVLERYHANPHEYGMHSYRFKQQSGRLDNSRRVVIGYLSGTFDLFHVGHLNLLRRARHECDYLIVGVHESGAWKGKETFIPFEERKAIVASCRYVDKVVDSCVEDSDAWELWHFDRLFVGSDYKGTERFNRYEEFFKPKGVEIIYFPYTQGTNSTQIRKTVQMRTESSEK